ncbi:MAG: exo-alpha-sialidase [Gemmatimonadota bacterium]
MFESTRPHHRRCVRIPAAACALAALALTACAGTDEPLPIANLHEIESPPGAGSGEAHLAPDGDGVILSWLEPVAGRGDVAQAGGEAARAPRHALRMARLAGEEWSESHRVADGDNFFVNWADFPSVTPVAPGLLAAHWLVRGPAGGYDYAIHIALSGDGGRSWSASWIPHEDGTPTEHGFVSILPVDEETFGVVWLDGRDYARAEEEGGERDPEMALRFRQVALGWVRQAAAPPFPGDGAAEEVVIDSRVCDCCQTAAARTARGLVAVYRDRSPQEVRDISVVRFEDGRWSDPVPVHRDDWVINACPVNGPDVAASGDDVAVAWFTGADDRPAVKLSFSADAGTTFGEPIEIDGGNPAGRVGVALLEDGSALVSWLERAGGGAEVRVRRVTADGRSGSAHVVASSSASRASGFPQMAVTAEERLVFAWTDPSDSDGTGRVRVATADIPERP